MTSEHARRALELAIELTMRDRDERLRYLEDLLAKCTLDYERPVMQRAIDKMTADYQHRIDTLVKLL